jgi:hypothetical protein
MSGFGGRSTKPAPIRLPGASLAYRAGPPLREAPQFRVAPAPTEEEAAVIAGALSWWLEQEAHDVVAEADVLSPSPWVAEGRRWRSSRMSGRGRDWGTGTAR